MKLPTKKMWRQGYVKLMNHSASPEVVSRGVAVGLFCAFIIPFGQMALAFLLATIFRAAKFPSLLFTWLSNPFTIAIIYPLQCFVGSFLLRQHHTYHEIVALLKDVIHNPSLETFAGLGTDLILPFFTGGLALGLVTGGVGYVLALFFIHRFRRKKRLKKEERRKWHLKKQKEK